MKKTPALTLTALRPTDAPALVEHLQCREIFDQTLRIPWPYNAALAQEFLASVLHDEKIAGRRLVWAIRKGRTLVGVIGLEGEEVGYWIAKPHWNKGFATEALRQLVTIAFKNYKFQRIKACAFPTNPASRRVLEKCGFQLIGLQPGGAIKEGRPIDILQFVLER